MNKPNAEERPLPWYVCEPRGRPGHTKYTVRDAEEKHVCECGGEDGGREEAVAIAHAINRAGPCVCSNCGAPATCFGSYESDLTPAFGCDECCGHGCEDGHCSPVHYWNKVPGPVLPPHYKLIQIAINYPCSLGGMSKLNVSAGYLQPHRWMIAGGDCREHDIPVTGDVYAWSVLSAPPPPEQFKWLPGP